MIYKFMGKYRFLSNFHLKEILYEGLFYPSTENAYQAAKTLSIEERLKFINIEPKQAKRLGKKVDLRLDWEQIKFKVMYDVCKEKFKDGEEKKLLLDTGEEYLVEGNYWHDTVYGFCFGQEFRANDDFLFLPRCIKCGGGGKNALGKILMNIRKELQIS